jgi:hypothetical protein
MDKKFICKSGASNYYLANDGMGGFLNPPGHPVHTYSILEFRGGHYTGSIDLSYAAICEYLPLRVRLRAKNILKHWQAGIIDENWVASVYNYFRHCYSKDGISRDVNNCITYGRFWDNADQEQNENPRHHLGYMYVKQFYPDHEPDLERIKNNDSRGSWSRE